MYVQNAKDYWYDILDRRLGRGLLCDLNIIVCKALELIGKP